VGPVGDAKAPAVPQAPAASVQLALGGTPPTPGQSLSALVTFLNGVDAVGELRPEVGEIVANGGTTESVLVEAPEQLAGAPAPDDELEVTAIVVEPPTPAEVAVAPGDAIPIVTALLSEDAGQGRSGRRSQADHAEQADLGWLAGLTAFGALTLTFLRRHQAGRCTTAVKRVASDNAPPPGGPLGLGWAMCTGRRSRRRRNPHVPTGQVV
jgi:hypothetical protein